VLTTITIQNQTASARLPMTSTAVFVRGRRIFALAASSSAVALKLGARDISDAFRFSDLRLRDHPRERRRSRTLLTRP
jgi:hypothetical protein